MASAVLEREPVTALDYERPAINEVDQLLEARAAGLAEGANRELGEVIVERNSCAPVFRLTAPDGRGVELPLSVVRLLHDLVHHLAHDRAVSIVPLHKELTTQQAADLLNVSRPHLISLLERGELPYTRPGKHRRIKFSDVMEYKHRRDQSEKEALDELAQLSQDLGLYR